MTEIPHADALLINLISGEAQIEAFADLTDKHEREKALHVLLALLTDPDLRLRVRAAQALAALGDRRAVEPLIHSLHDPNDRVDLDDRAGPGNRVGLDVLMAKTDALIALGDPAAIQPLLLEIGIKVKQVLEAFDREDVFCVLCDACEHDDWVIRNRAVHFLTYLKEPRSLPLFLKALTDENLPIRRDAISGLIDLRLVESVPSLLTHTSNPHLDVRVSIATLLGVLGDKQAVPALIPLLHDKDEQVRIHTALALGKLGDSSGLAVIQEHIKKGIHAPGAVYIGYIAQALSMLQAAGVPLLLELVGILLEKGIYKREDIITSIADTLAQYGDVSALPVLDRMLESGDEAVRQAAQQAIDAIKARIEDCDV